MLSQENNLDTPVRNKLLSPLDNAYNYYKRVTGKEPAIVLDYYYHTLRSILQVNSNCAAVLDILEHKA